MGEQTIARAPDESAFRARATAKSNGARSIPIANRAGESSEVNTVTAVIEIAGASSTAALIMAAPPEACTVRNLGCKSRIARTAPATVLGMSWSLRSRKSSKSLTARNSRNPSGPCLR